MNAGKTAAKVIGYRIFQKKNMDTMSIFCEMKKIDVPGNEHLKDLVFNEIQLLQKAFEGLDFDGIAEKLVIYKHHAHMINCTFDQWCEYCTNNGADINYLYDLKDLQKMELERAGINEDTCQDEAREKMKLERDQEEKLKLETEEHERVIEYRNEAMKTSNIYVLMKNWKCLTIQATGPKRATVIQSEHPKWKPGDKIFLRGSSEWKWAWPTDKRGNSIFFPSEDERLAR